MPSANACWGIEVGAAAVKALKVERNGDELKVTDFVALPHKKVLSTPDIDTADATRITLAAFMNQFRDALKGVPIVVSVPGHAAFARFAKLPPVQPKEVPNVVEFEAKQQIPFAIEDVEWDYQTFASEDSPDIEVGIFAITKQRINEMLALYGEVGLVPDMITLSPLAVFNSVAYDLSFTEKTPGTVILDVGTTSTDLIIADGGRAWIRTFPLGGHAFTQALAETFKLNYSKAEKLKAEAESSKYRKHIFQAIRPVLADLVQDVQRSISYYEDTHPGSKLQRIIAAGSTFRLPGLRKLLSQSLKLEVYRLERFKRISIEGPGASEFEAVTMNMATAYGLALQGLGLNTIDANLMPVSVIRKKVWKEKVPWFVAAATLSVVAGGVSFLRPFLDSAAVNRALNDRAVTQPVNEAKSLGSRLKSEWESVSETNKPGFVAENMRRLLDGRDLYPLVLTDISDMLSKASEQANLDVAFEVKALNTAYIKPGQTLNSSAITAAAAASALPQTEAGGGFGAPGGVGRDSEFRVRPGMSDGFGAAEPAGGPAGQQTAPEDQKAGERGALGVRLVVDSMHPATIAFVNDSILSWLRANQDRPDKPYVFKLIPSGDTVSWSPVTTADIPGQPSAAASATRDSTTSSAGGFGGSSSAKSGGSIGVGSLPPLPADLRPDPKQGDTHRYVIEWFLDLRDPPGEKPAEPTADAASHGQEEEAAS